MPASIEDLEAVRALIELYVGGSNGDVAKLERAFHPDARMIGHIGSISTNRPITELISFVAAHPGLAGPGYRGIVRTIDLVGDAGVAVLVETDWWAATSSTTSRSPASMVAG